VVASLLLVAMPLIATGPLQAAAHAGAPPRRDWAKVDVCRMVPGEAIARALGARLVEARPFADKNWSRCTYIVAVAGSDARAGYTLYMQPAGEFEEMKAYIEEPIAPIAALGDAAYGFRDKGDGRYKIYVLKRDDLLFQATGESEATARKVAEAVVGVLWKKTP
jgi:hypothetical protein